MNTESNKFKKSIRISHNHDAPAPGGTTSGGTATEETTEETSNETGNSGKFDGTSVVNTAINGVTDILEALLRKPDSYITNITQKDNTGLYIGIGAGVLVLIALIFVLFKK